MSCINSSSEAVYGSLYKTTDDSLTRINLEGSSPPTIWSLNYRKAKKMTQDIIESITEATRLLENLNAKEGKEREDVHDFFHEASDTVAMAAVLMASIYSDKKGWEIPSLLEASRFLEEAIRRTINGKGIPLRYIRWAIDEYNMYIDEWVNVSVFFPANGKEHFLGGAELGTLLFNELKLPSCTRRQDVLPIIKDIEKMLG